MRFLLSFLVTYFSSDKKLYQSLKHLLGFYPRNIELYKNAFRHRSVSGDVKSGGKTSNERLEYLGDAILGAVIAHYLFKRFPYQDEGFLTKMRSKMASRNYLNKLAVKLRVDQFVQYQGDKRGKFSWIYGDAFEALIGAIYIDRGYNFTKTFIIERIIKFHVDIEELESTDEDYKSKLINWAQREKKELVFQVEGEFGTGHERQYRIAILINREVMGRSTDISKKRAEQQAAEKACEQLFIE